MRHAIQKNEMTVPPAKASGQRRRETIPKEVETACRLIMISGYRFNRKLAKRNGLLHQIILVGFRVVGMVSRQQAKGDIASHVAICFRDQLKKI
jgi:hypothetical protein